MTERSPCSFPTTRCRVGYDMAAVDKAVAELRDALERSRRTINELRGDLAELRLRTELSRPLQTKEPSAPTAAAARMLELAAVRAECALSAANTNAEDLLTAARGQADDLLAEARARAEDLAAETERRCTTQLEETDRRTALLEEHLEALRLQQAEDRASLRAHLAEQLARLDECAPASLPAATR